MSKAFLRLVVVVFYGSDYRVINSLTRLEYEIGFIIFTHFHSCRPQTGLFACSISLVLSNCFRHTKCRLYLLLNFIRYLTDIMLFRLLSFFGIFFFGRGVVAGLSIVFVQETGQHPVWFIWLVAKLCGRLPCITLCINR